MSRDPFGLVLRAASRAAGTRLSEPRAVVALLAIALLMSVLISFVWPARPIHAQSDAAGDLFGDEVLGDDDLFGDEPDLFDDSQGTDAASDETAAPEDSADAPIDSEVPAPPDDPPAVPISDEIRPLDPTPTQGVEEILIQGQRGSGIDVEAPVSVTSFNPEDLEAMGVQDIGDLAAYTPNTEIRSAGATRPTFFIRGVGLNDFTANAAGAIAIFQDDVILGLPAIQLGQLFDTESVNVLKGPQGSGPGRNASGGAIHVTSRRPTGDFGGFLRAEFGRYSSKDFEGALELPLLADVLSARFAFRATERSPYVRNGCGGAPPFNDRVPGERFCGENERIVNDNGDLVSALPPGLDHQLNDQDRWAGRGQLRWQPPDLDLDILFNVHGGRVDQLARAGQVVGTSGTFLDGETGEKVFGVYGGTVRGYRPPEISRQQNRIRSNLGCSDLPRDERPACNEKAKRILARRLAEDLDDQPYRGDYNRPGTERSSLVGGFVKVNWQLENYLLSSTSGLETYDRYLNTDADFAPVVQFETKVSDKAWQFTEDLRISGELDEYPVSWDGGFYYLMDSLDYDRESPPGLQTVAVRALYRQETWSAGAYLGGSWEFLDEFTLEGGVRYQLERKTFDQRLFRGTTSPVPPGTPGRVCDAQDCTADRTYHAPTGSLSLVYHASEDVSFYWKYSRGWKSAQYSGGGGSGDVFTFAKPESVDSFEVGSSGAWFDGRLTLRVSAFHYSYQDYQVFITKNDARSPPLRVVVNADDAEIYGAEFEASLEPVDGLLLRGRGGWLESEFLDFTNQQVRVIPLPPPDPSEVAQITIDYAGNRLPNTPRFTASGSVEYKLELGRYGALIPRWDFTWTDDISFDQSNGRGTPNDDGIQFMPDHAIGQRAYWLHNVRLSWRAPGEQFEVAGWVRNLEDTVYKQVAYDASAADLVGNILGDRRTYGVTFSFSW